MYSQLDANKLSNALLDAQSKNLTEELNDSGEFIPV